LLGATPAGDQTVCTDGNGNTPYPYFKLLNGNITVRQT